MSESPEEARARRAAAVARIRDETGIDAAMIERLVDEFYRRVRADAVLGPLFESRIVDWPKHLAQMYRFWGSVLLYTAQYTGSPMARHRALPIDASHFDHWLELFERTAREVTPPKAAALFAARARRMAQSLALGVEEARSGESPPGTSPGA
ncbi:MAG: group III truncated hemoglobin [Steroidobacteraceae bacterium]